MNDLIKYMQCQHLNIDDTSLNELCKELLNQLINSPDIIGKTFSSVSHNNINFATGKILSNIEPIWETIDNNTFILKGWKEI